MEEIKKIAIILHSVLFAFERTMTRDGKMLGKYSEVTPNIISIIEDVIGDLELDLKGSVETITEEYLKLLKSTEMFKGLEIEKKDDTYVLKIGECPFATRVHEKFELIYYTCPFALFLASLLEKVSEKRVFIGLSKFTEKGSETEIST
ncbi:MAG: hypothetical protein ACE5K0_11920 [Candidatus Methanofastidiosia archaeon]